MIDSARQERNQQIMHNRIEAFTRQWQPDHARERAQFSADLSMLITTAHTLMAEAYGDAMGKQLNLNMDRALIFQDPKPAETRK